MLLITYLKSISQHLPFIDINSVQYLPIYYDMDSCENKNHTIEAIPSKIL